MFKFLKSKLEGFRKKASEELAEDADEGPQTAPGTAISVESGKKIKEGKLDDLLWDLEVLEPRVEKEAAFAVKMNKEGEGVFRAGVTCKENVSVDSSLGLEIVTPRLTISKTGPASLLRGTADICGID